MNLIKYLCFLLFFIAFWACQKSTTSEVNNSNASEETSKREQQQPNNSALDLNFVLFSTHEIEGGGTGEDLYIESGSGTNDFSEYSLRITGKASNLNLLVKEGDIVLIDKQGLVLEDKLEFAVPRKTMCDNVTILATSGAKESTKTFQFECGH